MRSFLSIVVSELGCLLLELLISFLVAAVILLLVVSRAWSCASWGHGVDAVLTCQPFLEFTCIVSHIRSLLVLLFDIFSSFSEVCRDCVVHFQLAQAQDSGTQFVLLHSKLNIVKQHVINHGEHVIAHIFFVHLQQFQGLGQLFQLTI